MFVFRLFVLAPFAFLSPRASAEQLLAPTAASALQTAPGVLSMCLILKGSFVPVARVIRIIQRWTGRKTLRRQ
jgi:hypothetical protein